MIDPTDDRALYKQVADVLRARIRDGAYAPGELLPSESQLMQEFGLARNAIRAALALLRAEGVIETVRGVGSFVREPTERRIVRLHPGDEVVFERGPEARMVARITRASGEVEEFDAETVVIRAGRR